MQGKPVFITVDPGSTHQGKLHYAKELIRVAADCGADAIKFQLFQGPKYTEVGNIELNRDWLGELYGIAKERHIYFTCSVFDRAAADLLLKFTDIPYIKFAYSMRQSDIITGLLNIGRTVVVSTDRMHLRFLTPHQRMFTLFCKPQYPTMETTNFEDIFRSEWGAEVESRGWFDGLSDHSLGFRESVRAVEAGARMVEKHMTLPYSDITCPDSQFALTPKRLRVYISEIRKLGTYWPANSSLDILR